MGQPCNCIKEVRMTSLLREDKAFWSSLRVRQNKECRLKQSDPDLFKYFENVWSVHENHMNKDLPKKYIFMLNLCFKPECPHPLCLDKSVRRDAAWYEYRPVLSYIPVPISDPARQFGREMPRMHYLLLRALNAISTA